MGGLKKHEEVCLQFKTQRVVVPPKDSTISFTNFQKKFKIKYCGFFDLESCLKPQLRCDKCDSCDCVHKTVVENEQQPITYSYIIVDNEGSIVHQNTYTGEDCVQHFISELLSLEQELMDNLEVNIPMKISSRQQAIFEKAITCHICEKEFLDEEERVRDHCHLSGEYLGAAHVVCNLKRVETKFIPFFAHNFTAYDSHFLVQKLNTDARIKKITALPLNSEKFRTIQINSFHFLDSLSFLNASLSELTNDLVNERVEQNKGFPILDQMHLPNVTSQNQKLLLRKGVFPYEYVTSLNTLNETQIPKKEDFFSKLSNTHITEGDYQHAQHVFSEFECETLKDYCELYCATDVGLLAEIMCQFREEIFDNHQLDCCHYISLPQMAYDLMLKKTGVEIEIVSDIDKLMFFEANIHGGLSFVNQRYCKNTNKTDDVKEHVEMLYLDGECCLPYLYSSSIIQGE